MKRPNILLVMADQMTAFALRAYGNRVCRTPNLDKLAAGGTLFENAYCTFPLCAPSRFSMMSGRLPSRIAAYDNAAEFPSSVPTVAHYLRDAGYYTCLSGKMHFVGPDQLHGFEDRLTTEIYPAGFEWTPNKTFDDLMEDPDMGDGKPHLGVSSVETVADAGPVSRSLQLDYDDEVGHRARQHIFDWRRSGDQRPLFMTVSFTQPHDPYVVSREFWDLYSEEEIDLPRVGPIPADKLDPHTKALRRHYNLDRFEVTEAIYRRARRGYYGMISYVDQQLGRLMETLKACGMEKDTVVVFTSDHGDMIGERGLWFKKNLFDPAVRVPLLMRIPGREPGHVKAPVSVMDLLPTILEVIDGDIERIVTPIEGRSLLPLLDRDDPERTIFAEHLDGAITAPRVMIRQGPWKLVTSQAYPTQLYNLDQDPGELDNHSDDPSFTTVVSSLMAKVEETWDLDRLRMDIVYNQKVRQMLCRALAKGRPQPWESEPNAPAQMSFIRGDDRFPGVERKRYLPYAD